MKKRMKKILLLVTVFSLALMTIILQDAKNTIYATSEDEKARFSNVTIEPGARLYFNNKETTYVENNTVLSKDTESATAGDEASITASINAFEGKLAGDAAKDKGVLYKGSLPSSTDIANWTSNIPVVSSNYWLHDTGTIKKDAFNVLTRAYANSNNSLPANKSIKVNGKVSKKEAGKEDVVYLYDNEEIYNGSHINIEPIKLNDYTKLAGYYYASGKTSVGMPTESLLEGADPKSYFVMAELNKSPLTVKYNFNIGNPAADQTGDFNKVAQMAIYDNPQLIHNPLNNQKEVKIKQEFGGFSDNPDSIVAGLIIKPGHFISKYDINTGRLIPPTPGEKIPEGTLLVQMFFEVNFTGNPKFRGYLTDAENVKKVFAPEGKIYYLVFFKTDKEYSVTARNLDCGTLYDIEYIPSDISIKGSNIESIENTIRPKMILDTSNIKFARSNTFNSTSNSSTLGAMPTTSLKKDENYKLVLKKSELGVNTIKKEITNVSAVNGDAKVSEDNEISVTPGTTQITLPISTKGGNKVSAISTKKDGTTNAYGVVGNANSNITIDIADLMDTNAVNTTKTITLFNEEFNGAGKSDSISLDGLDIIVKVDNVHKVEFVTNGGAPIASQYVNDGEKVERPVDPTYTDEHHMLEGWYKDSGLKNKYDFNEKVTADLILYAKWEPSVQDAAYFVEVPSLLYLKDERDGAYATTKDTVRVVMPPEIEEQWYPTKDILVRTDITIPLSLKDSNDRYDVHVFNDAGIEYTDPSKALVKLNAVKIKNMETGSFILKTPQSKNKKHGAYTGTMRFYFKYDDAS